MRTMLRLLSLLLLSLGLLLQATATAATDEFGHTLYRAQHGAPDGYPGCFPDTVEKEDKEGNKTVVAKYPKWGHPELENYPGSVEHFRHKTIKYLPAINPFNAETLVRDWQMGDAGVPTEKYAEPIYYMPMYGNPVFTGRHRTPVPVYRLKKDGTNAITISLGKLPRGMYAVRIVGAIESEPKDWTGDPETLVIRCSLNAGPNGTVRTWTRRHRAVDEFYATGEWYFHAVDDRTFNVEIRLDPKSEVDLLVHNLDLHDCLGGCPEKVIKRKATLYTTESRRAAQAYYAKHNKMSRGWGPNIHYPREKGLWQGKPLPPDARRERDDTLWRINPPQTMNLQAVGQYGKYDQAAPPPKKAEQYGNWEVPYRTRYRRAWDKVRLLVNKKLNLTYTMDDYLAGRPLPDPYPFKASGYGILIEGEKGEGYFHPVMSGMTNTDPFYKILGHTEVGALCLEYYNRNNLHAARDAAFILARLAYTLPSQVTAQKRRLQQVVCRPAQCFGFNDPVNRRYTGHEMRHLVHVARAYDMLFDYIDGNEELARAVGRHIPWIKTPKDLRAFLDQRLLTWSMKQARNHRVTSSHGTPNMVIQLATIAQDAKATRPLMEYLFTATWDYPLPLSGIQDYMVSGTTRDGTTTIGSFAYTAGGSPFLKVADMVNVYIENGGDRQFNLADPRRFPKPFMAAYFNIDARVAGMWPLGIGDVGGQMRYGQWFESQEGAARIGWRYLQDPTLAWIVKAYFGRKAESDEEWDKLQKAATRVDRNPWMANRSRVLSTWAGILESGTQHDDYRFRRAATVRVGVGWGHSHRDTLDLQLFALGCQMTPDGGQRPGYGRPDCITSMNHNVVEVDGDGGRREGNWEGHAWVRTLADVPGAPVMRVEAVPPGNKRQVRHAERTIMLVDVDEGLPSNRVPSDASLRPGTIYPRDVVLPKSYALDVYRLAGGKRHTYCFHGCAEDLFTVNAVNPRKVPLPSKADLDKDADARYLRKYVIEGYQGAGDAPETVLATWRMSREPWMFETRSGKIDEGKTRTYKCGAPEQRNLGRNFDPAAPRKFTRLHLLNSEGARLLWGRWVSAPYTGTHGQWFTQLHVMRDGDEDRESVFAGIIETYAGTPAVASAKLLPVRENETDAMRAVAVAVETTNGRRDLLFADGRPDKARQVGENGMVVSAEAAQLSTDAEGLRQAGIVGGSRLHVPGLITIQPEQPAYAAEIEGVNVVDRTLTVHTDLPKDLGHAFWEVGNDRHRTSLEVVKVTGRRLQYRKSPELVSTRVVSVDPETKTVVGKLVSILMGAEEDNGMKPGMTGGLWATNEDATKWWRCTYTGGTRSEGYVYKLDGAPVTARDFPVNGAVRIWGMGPGDTMRLSTWVSIRRHPLAKRVWEVTGNVPCRLQLGKHTQLMQSTDRLTWTPLTADEHGGIRVNPRAAGTLYLRVRPIGQ